MRAILISLFFAALILTTCNPDKKKGNPHSGITIHSTIIKDKLALSIDSHLYTNHLKKAHSLYENHDLSLKDSLEKAYLSYKINKAVFYHNYFYPCDSLTWVYYDHFHPVFHALNEYYVHHVFHDEMEFKTMVLDMVAQFPDDRILKSEMYSEIGRYYFNEGNRPDSADLYYTLSLESFPSPEWTPFSNQISIWNLAYLQFTMRNNRKALIFAGKMLENLPENYLIDDTWRLIQKSLIGYCHYRLDQKSEGEKVFDEAYILTKQLPCTFAQQEWYKLYAAANLYRGNRSLVGHYISELDSIVTIHGDFCNANKIKGEYSYTMSMDLPGTEKLLEEAFYYILDNKPYNILQLYTVMYLLQMCYTQNENYDAALNVVYSQNLHRIPDGFYTFDPDSITGVRFMNRRYYYISLSSYAAILLNKYNKHKKLSDLLQAEKLIHLADSLVTREIKTFDDEVLRSVYTTSIPVYHTAANIAYELYKNKAEDQYLLEYLYYVEKNKSRILYRDIEILRLDDEEIKEYNKKEKAIRQNIEYFSHKNQPDSILSETKKLDQLFYRYRDGVRSDPLQSQKYRITDMATITQKLDRNQMFIDFNKMDDFVYILYISHEDRGLIRLPYSKELEDHIFLVISVKNQNNVRTPTEYNTSAYFLYDYFLKPIIGDIRNILYSTNHPMSLTNPETWTSMPHSEAGSFADLSFLIHDFCFERTESFYMHEKIEFSAIMQVTAFLHSDRKTLRSKNDARLREQPGNVIELEILEKLFPSIKVYSGAACTKNQFLQTIQNRSEILHISVHGYSNTIDRKDNYFLFRNKRNSSDTLFGYELISMSSLPELVVLAACESGKGKFEEGEGVYTLARYFLQSGSKRVVRSLWNLDDTSGSLLMRNFYQHINRSASVSESLYNAKKELLRKYPNFAHPYFWGGMI
ncbi:MAG TPA: CHAT domain-containing protein [Saprospiraceae bacterium]|nr:CHAT domain-containing protein [Saprospiraceae bacterium]